MLLIEAHSQTSDAAFEFGHVVRHGRRQTRRIRRIDSGDHSENGRAILDGSAHRTDVIEGVRQGEHPEATHPSPGRLQSDDSIGVAREADRSPRVGSQGCEAQPRRGAHPGSTGGDPRPRARVPGILRNQYIRVVNRVGAFGGLEFSEQHTAGLTQARCDGGLTLRIPVGVRKTTDVGRDPGGRTQVFQADRYPVEKPPDPPRPDFAVRILGLLEGVVGRDGDVGLVVSTLDPRKQGFGDVEAADLAAANSSRNLDQRLVVELAHGSSLGKDHGKPAPGKSQRSRADDKLPQAGQGLLIWGSASEFRGRERRVS